MSTRSIAPLSPSEIAAEAAGNGATPTEPTQLESAAAEFVDSSGAETAGGHGLIVTDGPEDDGGAIQVATPAAPVVPTSPTAPVAPAAAVQPQPGQPAQPAATPISVSGVRDWLREKAGLDTSRFQTDEAALEAYAHLQRKIGERDEYAQLGRQVAPFHGQFQQWLAAQAAGLNQQQPPATQVEEPKPWGPPEVPQAWNRFLEEDGEGGVKIKDSTPIALRQQIEETINARLEWFDAFRRNPAAALQGLRDDAVRDAEERILQQVEARQAAVAEASQAKDFIRQNAPWLLRQNGSGQYVTDPETGNFALSDTGRVFYSKLNSLAAAGMHPQQAQREAMDYTRLWASAQPAAAPAAPAAPIAPVQQPAAPAQPAFVPPTRQPIPPGAGGGRAMSGTRARDTVQPAQARSASDAFSQAYAEYDEGWVRDNIVLGASR